MDVVENTQQSSITTMDNNKITENDNLMDYDYEDSSTEGLKNCSDLCGKKNYFDPSTVTAPGSLSELIAALHSVFAQDDVCVEYVKKLMASYESSPKEWKKFAKFDQYKYTRNLVDEGNGKFNLMVLCWNEAQGSSIHSHADSHCFMKVLSGGIREELFEWPQKNEDTTTIDEDDDNVDDGKMRKVREMEFNKNEVTYINDSLGLHRVENSSHTDKAITLHLYSPPFQECQCFDERSGRITTSKMTFWSKYGKRTPYGKFPEKTTDQGPSTVENN